MRVQVLLLLLCVAGLAATFALPGLSAFRFLAGIAVLASLVLVLLFRSRGDGTAAGERELIVIDGSNVMYWRDNTPKLKTLKEVIKRLKKLGYEPGIVFDANAGHLLFGKYQHDRKFGQHLGLPEDQVMVVQKNTPADPIALMAARDLGARIVTNDRFRDWSREHPEIHKPGHLIKGGYRKGKLWIDLDQAGPAIGPRRKPPQTVSR